MSMTMEALAAKHGRPRSDEDEAARVIRAALRAELPQRRIEQAVARAHRAMQVPLVTPARAILRAIAWARDVSPPDAATVEGVTCSN